ncbi:MAG: DUF4062 domain-containing protein [Planctomycetes bacterium]|nr:DUF4062 domain-containing protein [Planctomycetota bacterium]
MAIRYQIFISSTFDDLRDEREQVLKASLEMGHIPVGMEMFSAADEEQWKIITRQIDECDYYAVIVAHRYGSVVDGISYTEKEYDYAVSQGIPVLGFVIEHDAPWPADRIEEDPEKKVSLEEFKAKVKQKPVGCWKTAADLHGLFSIALMKQIVSTPRPGWTRADQVAGPKVVKELSRLSSENADLRKQLAEALHKAEDDAAADRRRTMQTMRKNNVGIDFWYDDGKDWEDKKEVNLGDLFFLLAPELMIEKSTESIAGYVGRMMRRDMKRNPRSQFPVPSNSVKQWIADFVALDLFEPSPRRHSVKDTKEYWSLTTKGRETYTEVRRARLDEAKTPAESSGSDSRKSDGA